MAIVSTISWVIVIAGVAITPGVPERITTEII
jgi:hypothetical protein